MKTRIDWDKSTIKKFKQLNDKGKEILDMEVLKSSNFFIPMDLGRLMESALTATKLGSGRIIWDQPQAKRLYWNPQYNFSKDRNPNARGLWFEAAKAKDKEKWIEQIDKLKKGIF